MISKKDKEELIRKISPSIFYAHAHDHNEDYVEGYNHMLEKAKRKIREF